MIDYSDLLRSSHLKATTQRIGILRAIDRSGHVSIEEIRTMTHHTHPNLSLATIYKNILTMVGQNILTELPISGSKSKYEIKKTNHIHLICEVCGSVTDQPLDSIPKEPIERLLEKDAFNLTRSQINLYGVCQVCQ